MRRLPLWPTLFTVVAVIFMIGAGIWQLQRHEWKRDLIARLEAARTLPPVTPREFFKAIVGEGSVQYRRAVVACRPGRVAPYDTRGGESASGRSGFLILVACRDPAFERRRGPDLVVVAGFSPRPFDGTLTVDAEFDGTIVERPYGRKASDRPMFMLIPRTAVPPLTPARMPTPGDLPDSHLSYAGQWFGFAATLAIIYGIFVWRRRDTAVPAR